MIIYQIIAINYRIKNIGKGGIELERVIEENSIGAMQDNSELVEKIYRELGDLDSVVDYLYVTGKLENYMEEDEYLDILKLICNSLFNGTENIKIRVFNEKEYEKYLKADVGLSNRERRILTYRYEEYGIVKVDEGIHIKYRYASFHSFQNEQCYIVIQTKQIYDMQLGKLVYAYIKLFEALYSKYILIEQ